jgi:outer membrane protein assembly factor BamA
VNVYSIIVLHVVGLLFFNCLSCYEARAQEINDTFPAKKEKRIKLIPLPFAGYSPETQFFAGGVLVASMRLSKDTAVASSLCEFNLTVTQQQQLISEGKWYLNVGKYYVIKGFGSFARFPDKYWGIGYNTLSDQVEYYNSSRWRFSLDALRLVAPKLYMGLSYRMVNIQHLSHRKGLYLLDSTRVAGYDGSFTSSIGPYFLYDSRDHVFNTAKGSYYSIQAIFSEQFLGSHFNFMRYEMDLRKFFNPYKKQVLAVQFKTALTAGNTPFSVMPQIGSDEDMRGYYRGRYRDMTYFSMQAEYRVPLIRRVGMAIFGGMGNVGSNLTALYQEDPKFSYGAGLRFVLSEKQHVKLRIDYAMGMDNNQGLYALIGEAF